MPTEQQISELLELPAEERLALIDRLWDSLSEDPNVGALSSKEMTEVQQRIADYRANPEEGDEWEVVKARLLQRHPS